MYVDIGICTETNDDICHSYVLNENIDILFVDNGPKGTMFEDREAKIDENQV